MRSTASSLPCPPPLRLGPPMLDATSHPRPKALGRRMRAAHTLLQPHCNDSIRLSDCLPACLSDCLLVPTKERCYPSPANLSTAIGLLYSRYSALSARYIAAFWSLDGPLWSVGACLPQYAEAVPPAAAAATRIGEDTLPPSGLGPREHEQRRQAATVARVCDSVDLFVIYLACHVERLR
jgi:hypothetical protein